PAEGGEPRPVFGEPGGAAVAMAGVGQHEGVHHAAGEQLLVLVDVLGVRAGREEEHAVLAVLSRGGELVQEAVGDARTGKGLHRHREGDGARPSGAQLAGGGHGPVAQLGDGLADPGQRCGTHDLGAVECVRDGLPGDTGTGGDIGDRHPAAAHRVTLPSRFGSIKVARLEFLFERSTVKSQRATEHGRMPRQPLLHDLLTALAAPTQAWSAPDGQIRPSGAQGVFHGDVRVVSRAELTISGEEPEVISVRTDGPGVVNVVALARGIDPGGADPTVRIDRRRTVKPGWMSERIVVTSATAGAVAGEVRVTLAADFASMDLVKTGEGRDPLPATETAVGVLGWSQDGVEATVHAPGATLDLSDPTAPVLTWDIHVEPGVACTLEWWVDVVDPGGVVGPAPASTTPWHRLTVRSGDTRLANLVRQSLDDLGALRMSTTTTPNETFLAAGAPWFFTLFGRDSIWAARFLLPLGTGIAHGTLRTLAALQGRERVAATAEQPGKIIHEVRRATLELPDEGVELPPHYYGTVDATALWFCLLADARERGLGDDETRELLPALRATLAWMRDFGDSDGDGLLEYVDESGRGLSNQGWKDS